MICMEEAGMKKVLFRIIIPILILAAWMMHVLSGMCKGRWG